MKKASIRRKPIWDPRHWMHARKENPCMYRVSMIDAGKGKEVDRIGMYGTPKLSTAQTKGERARKHVEVSG